MYLDHLGPIDPRRFALQVLNDCGIAEPPVDERRILDYFQIDVERTPVSAIWDRHFPLALASVPSGMLIREPEGDASFIWVAPDVSRGRFRWTVFHELGHHDMEHPGAYLVDDERTLRPASGRRESLPTAYRQVGHQRVLLPAVTAAGEDFTPVQTETGDSLMRKRQEREANQYAREMIMPSPLFCPEARSLPMKIATLTCLADRYHASLEATALRYAQACPERCAIFAAEPTLNEDSNIEAFEVVYARRGRLSVPGLRSGHRVPADGLLAQAWLSRGPAEGELSGADLGLPLPITLAASALRLGRYERIITVLWLQAGQQELFSEGGYS